MKAAPTTPSEPNRAPPSAVAATWSASSPGASALIRRAVPEGEHRRQHQVDEQGGDRPGRQQGGELLQRPTSLG